MKGMLKPLATLFLFLALIINVNAQVLSGNGIKAPAVTSSHVAFNPGLITGTAVAIKDAAGSTCPDVTYEWQSASDASFTTNLKQNLATTKDYNPGKVSQTTFFRRVATIYCTDPERATKTTTSGIKITIQ